MTSLATASCSSASPPGPSRGAERNSRAARARPIASLARRLRTSRRARAAAAGARLEGGDPLQRVRKQVVLTLQQADVAVMMKELGRRDGETVEKIPQQLRNRTAARGSVEVSERLAPRVVRGARGDPNRRVLARARSDLLVDDGFERGPIAREAAAHDTDSHDAFVGIELVGAGPRLGLAGGEAVDDPAIIAPGCNLESPTGRHGSSALDRDGSSEI